MRLASPYQLTTCMWSPTYRTPTNEIRFHRDKLPSQNAFTQSDVPLFQSPVSNSKLMLLSVVSSLQSTEFVDLTDASGQ